MKKLTFDDVRGLLYNFSDFVLVNGESCASAIPDEDKIRIRLLTNKKGETFGWDIPKEANFKIENGLIVCDAEFAGEKTEITLACLEFHFLDSFNE